MKWTHTMLVLLIAAMVALPVLAQEDKKPAVDKEARKAAAAERAKKFHDAVTAAKVSLADAVTKAEAHAGGKAWSAAYRMGKQQKLIVAVQVMVEGKRKQVAVDADSGEVITKAAKPAKDKKDRPKKDKKPKKDKADGAAGGNEFDDE